MLFLEGGRVNKLKAYFFSQNEYLSMHDPTCRGGKVGQEIMSCRRNKLGECYEESSTWGKHNCQYVEGGGEMHRYISNISYNGDGGWHVGTGREQIGCANIKCTNVLQRLLPKLCQT